MQIKVSSKHVDLTPAIEEYITTKTQKLTRYFDRIEQIEAKIEKTKQGFTSEIIASVVQHDPIVSSCDDADLHASIDGCIDRSVRQLTDLKSRLSDKKHGNSSGGQ